MLAVMASMKPTTFGSLEYGRIQWAIFFCMAARLLGDGSPFDEVCMERFSCAATRHIVGMDRCMMGAQPAQVDSNYVLPNQGSPFAISIISVLCSNVQG